MLNFAAWKNKMQFKDSTASGWPADLSRPAIRALVNAGYPNLECLAGQNETSLASLHGMGPKGIRILKASLAAAGLGSLTDCLILETRMDAGQYWHALIPVSGQLPLRREVDHPPHAELVNQ